MRIYPLIKERKNVNHRLSRNWVTWANKSRTLGLFEGAADGSVRVGSAVGLSEGILEIVGVADGFPEGINAGALDGKDIVGAAEGIAIGKRDGVGVGSADKTPSKNDWSERRVRRMPAIPRI